MQLMPPSPFMPTSMMSAISSGRKSSHTASMSMNSGAFIASFSKPFI